MVYNLLRRESPDCLFNLAKNDENSDVVKKRPIRHIRNKSDSLIDFSSFDIDQTRRSISPALQLNSREQRVHSLGTLTTRKFPKDKDQLLHQSHVLEPINDGNSMNINKCECDNKSINKLTPNSGKLCKSNILFDAVLDNDFTLLQKLVITDSFDVNEANVEGHIGLHFAAAAGHLECLQLLLECGSKVNTVDDYFRTPLEYAVISGYFDIASLLISNGADTTVIKDGIL